MENFKVQPDDYKYYNCVKKIFLPPYLKKEKLYELYSRANEDTSDLETFCDTLNLLGYGFNEIDNQTCVKCQNLRFSDTEFYEHIEQVKFGLYFL